MSMFGEKKKAAYKGYRALSEEKDKAEKARLLAKQEAAAKNADGRPTFAYFAAHDEAFRAACSKAGVEPTARQASKWHKQRGKAYESIIMNGWSLKLATLAALAIGEALCIYNVIK